MISKNFIFHFIGTLNKYLILVDVKSGRFKYQSGRAGDESKKRKSPAKSRRVGIYAMLGSKKVGI